MVRPAVKLIAVSILLAGAVHASPSELPNLEHTPAARPYAQAMHDFQNERYFSARHNFLIAARWADKIAQFNLGVIYYHGHGVTADREHAWAWFQLAAERGYPQLVEMADLVWEEFDEPAQARAREWYSELVTTYGDEAAVPRTARYMELEQRRMTGSRVGMIGALTIVDGDGNTRTGEDFYRAEDRDFRLIVQRETALYRQLATGRVEIGDFEVIRSEDEEKPR